MLVSKDHIREIAKDLGVLGKFVAVYCRHHHRDAVRERFAMRGMDLSKTSLGKRKVCPECAKLLAHAVTKRARSARWSRNPPAASARSIATPITTGSRSGR